VEINSVFVDTFSAVSFITLHTSIICEYSALVAPALEVHLVVTDPLLSRTRANTVVCLPVGGCPLLAAVSRRGHSRCC
jgi:hypothetical protein